jgi:predicted RNase H-like nuclease
MITPFLGLDLAWSPRNNSAAEALEAEDAQARWVGHSERLGGDARVLSFIGEAAGSGPAPVVMDAPLIVPNEEGSRPVDRVITSLFGHFRAFCRPANLTRSCTRGEDRVTALAADGFVLDSHMRQGAVTRTVFEAYPHPAMIYLFDLPKPLICNRRRK